MTYMIQMLNSIYRNGIEMKEVIQELEMATKPGYFDFKIYALTAAVVILVGFLYGILSKQFRVIDYFTCIILIEIMLCITSVSPLSRTLASGCILVLCASFITLVVMLMVHNIYGLIQQKKWQEKLKKEAGVVKKLFWFYVIYLPVIYLVNRFGLFFAIIVIVLIVGGVLLLAVSGFLFIKDYMKDKCWIKKQPDLRSMSRKMLACNLEKLHTQKCKRIYVEELLQKKITLTGTWPNDVRPKYNDDRLELDLAKLDCNKLESCNYLF